MNKQDVCSYARDFNPHFSLKSEIVLYDKTQEKYKIHSSYVPLWLINIAVAITKPIFFLKKQYQSLKLIIDQAKDAKMQFDLQDNKNYISVKRLKDRVIDVDHQNKRYIVAPFSTRVKPKANVPNTSETLSNQGFPKTKKTEDPATSVKPADSSQNQEQIQVPIDSSIKTPVVDNSELENSEITSPTSIASKQIVIDSPPTTNNLVTRNPITIYQVDPIYGEIYTKNEKNEKVMNEINQEATKKAQEMLSDLINEGHLWMASDEDRANYKDNFYDIVEDDLNNVTQDQLFAYKCENTVYLTTLSGLYQSLETTGKFGYAAGGDVVIPVFKVEDNKAVISNSDSITKGICPPGKMSIDIVNRKLPAYSCNQAYRITYDIPTGTQGQEHPHPGVKYNFSGNPRVCFVPANSKGTELLIMLIQCWEHRLTFSVGTSTTSGKDDQVIWGIHHKTNDKAHRLEKDNNYLQSASVELYKRNITRDTITKMKFESCHRDEGDGMKVELNEIVLQNIQDQQLGKPINSK